SVRAYERATKEHYAWSAEATALARRTDAAARAADIAAGQPPPALLIIHGSDDALMPAQIASELYEALLPRYQRASAAERLRLDPPPIAHSWTGDSASAQSVRAEVGAWFRQFSRPRRG